MDGRVERRIAMKVPMLAMLFIVCLIALSAGVSWWPEVAVADAGINNFFGPYRAQPLLAGFMWLTTLGANTTVVAVCVTMTGSLWVARLSGLILPLWIAFVGGEATSWGLKYLVGRTRPPFLEVASATSPSFPSGHSMSSMVVYGFVAFVLTSRGPRARLGIAAPVALAVLILLIGFSRVFLSLHYTSDVLGGFLVGGFWLLMAIMLSKRIEAQSSISTTTRGVGRRSGLPHSDRSAISRSDYRTMPKPAKLREQAQAGRPTQTGLAKLLTRTLK